MKNIKAKKAIMISALSGMIAMTTLTGCTNNNSQKYTRGRAIVHSDNTVTIIDISNYRYDKNFMRLDLPSGETIFTNIFDTKVMIEYDITAEDFAKAIYGNDIEINYLNRNKELTMKKGN
jgi:hypothetical protein